MLMMVETWAGNSIKTLKAVIHGKLLTLNVLGQHLSLLETRNFHRRQTNLAFEVVVWHKCGKKVCSSKRRQEK